MYTSSQFDSSAQIKRRVFAYVAFIEFPNEKLSVDSNCIYIHSELVWGKRQNVNGISYRDNRNRVCACVSVL